MPVVVGIADVHVGNHKQFGGSVHGSINHRCSQILDALQSAVDTVARLNGVLVIAGDLIDVVRPEAQILARLQDILLPVPTVIVKGNHESCSNERGDHALGPLRAFATVVEEPAVLSLDEGDGDAVNLWCVPARPDAAEGWLPGVMEELSSARAKMNPDAADLMAVHLGISDAGTAKFLRNVNDQIPSGTLAKLCAEHGVRFVMAGNWHKRQAWHLDGVHIQQLGALVPTGWNNPGLEGYGGMSIYTRGEVEMAEVQGPRFVKVVGGRAEVDEVIAMAENSPQLYMEVHTDPANVDPLSDYLDSVIAGGHLAARRVVGLRTRKDIAAKRAVASAKAAGSVSGSLEGFVTSMPLDEDLDRDKVLSLSRDILTEAMKR